MRTKLVKFAVTLMIAALMMSMAPAFAGVPNTTVPADAMWIEDDNKDLDGNYSLVNLTTANPLHTTGFKFNITVWLNITSANVFAYSIGLNYNKTILGVNGMREYLKAVRAGCTDPPAPSQFMEPNATTFPAAQVDTSYLGNGTVLCTETFSGEDFRAVPRVGSTIWVEFEVLKTPGKNEVIEGVFNISMYEPGDTWVRDTSLALIDITTYDAYYKFKWAQPTTYPHMAIEHDGFYGVPPSVSGPADSWPIIYGPYPPSAVGAAFDVKIYIENLVPAWDLVNASFRLLYNSTVIDVLGGVANITIDAAWGAGSTKAYVAGQIDIYVEDYTPAPPSGKVPVATIKFTVMLQQAVPPYPVGHYDFSMLTFTNVVFKDHTMEITHYPADDEEGEVRILGIVALPMAWLEVQPEDTVLETDPCHTVLIGKEFDVNVTVKNLHPAWYLTAFQFRLSFDPTLLQLVSVTEGPFLTDSRWNLYGTWPLSDEEPANWFPHHVWVFNMLMPNGTGEYDQTIFPRAPGPNVTDLKPPVDPVLATIRFKVLEQECFGGENLTCGLDILPFWYPEDCHFIDRDANFLPTDTAKIVNGTCTIMPMYQYGRIIDVYGGAVNRGYGVTYGTPAAFPAPFGGQGVGGDMDLVIPQSVVYLLAYVTYNCWPVQSKDVGFEIDGPFEQEGWTREQPVPREAYYVRKYSNRTSTGDCENPGGVAWIKFQMPWPCDNPEDYFGKYRVTATVDICGVVVTDVLWFDYYYLVEITKVTTDEDCYPHCNDVIVSIEFRSKAQQKYPVLFAVVLQDELETHVSAAYYSLNVSGAEFCHWNTYTITVKLHVEKWAFAGIGHIYVSAFDCDPTDISPITGQHGAPWCPTYGLGWPLDEQGVPVPLPEICIYPY